MSRALTKRTNTQLAKNGNDNNKQFTYHRNADWIIADVSGSMEQYLPNTKTRRIDCLNAAIAEQSLETQVLAFSDNVIHSADRTFSAKFGTSLIPALTLVKDYEPSYIVLISDGEINDDHERNLALVDEIARSAIIDTLYIGPDNANAIAFMAEIARRGNGRMKRFDLTRPNQEQLTTAVQRLLPGPNEIIKV